MTIKQGVIAAAIATAALLTAHAQNAGERIWSPPRIGCYFSMQHTNWAPIPCFPNFPCEVAVYSRGMYNGHISYIMDDRDVDYPAWQSSYESLSTSSTDSP